MMISHHLYAKNNPKTKKIAVMIRWKPDLYDDTPEMYDDTPEMYDDSQICMMIWRICMMIWRICMRVHDMYECWFYGVMSQRSII